MTSSKVLLITVFALLASIAFTAGNLRKANSGLLDPDTFTKCSKKDKAGDSCLEIYKPVCGFKPNVVCVLPGCNYQTYSNACEACHDTDVASSKSGECPTTQVVTNDEVKSTKKVEIKGKNKPLPKPQPKPEPKPEPIVETKPPMALQCSKASRLGDFCTKEYRPVCGYKPNVMCIALVGVNCNYVTYSNACEACHDKDVESYTQGECPKVEPVPVPEPEPEPVVEVSQKIQCSKDSRLGDVCPALYKPVCGYKPNIMCIALVGVNCNYITYGNSCEACHDADVESYTEGECPNQEIPISEPVPVEEPTQCTESDRFGESCDSVYAPVCGYKPAVLCILPGCNYQTYSNACEACHDADVGGYTQGECQTIVEPGLEPEPVPVKETQCTKDDRLGDSCDSVYAPVCGYKPDVVCILPGCNYQTYSNACEACHDAEVLSHTEGECQPIIEPGLEPEPVPVKENQCTKESRLGDACFDLWAPVCGYKPNVACIALVGVNCNYVTYGNSCEACHDADVVSYTQGECPKVEPIPEPEPEPVPVKQTQCSKDSRLADACFALYKPVCGYKPNVACIALVGVNCNYVTYGNSCEACHDADVESYTEGECQPIIVPDLEPEPVPVPAKETQCTKDDRLGDACFDIWAPVCGYKPDIMCITTPCNYITYPNSCEACHDADVVSYTQGECPSEKPKPTVCDKSEVIYGCPDNYDPVCGYKPNLACFTEPCDNYVTFFNSCEACSDPDVENYTPGECVQGDLYY